MKTVNSAILTNIISAGTFFVFVLAVYVAFLHIYPQPFFAELPVEMRAKIQQINDIEHLRKVALQLDANDRSNMKTINKLFGLGVNSIIVLLVAPVILCLGNLGYWLRLLREQRGDPIPLWLRWLSPHYGRKK